MLNKVQPASKGAVKTSCTWQSCWLFPRTGSWLVVWAGSHIAVNPPPAHPSSAQVWSNLRAFLECLLWVETENLKTWIIPQNKTLLNHFTASPFWEQWGAGWGSCTRAGALLGVLFRSSVDGTGLGVVGKWGNAEKIWKTASAFEGLSAPVKALYLAVFRVLILGEEVFSCGEEEQMNLTAA